MPSNYTIMGITTIAPHLHKESDRIDSNGRIIKSISRGKPAQQPTTPQETKEEKKARLLKELAELE